MFSEKDPASSYSGQIPQDASTASPWWTHCTGTNPGNTRAALGFEKKWDDVLGFQSWTMQAKQCMLICPGVTMAPFWELSLYYTPFLEISSSCLVHQQFNYFLLTASVIIQMYTGRQKTVVWWLHYILTQSLHLSSEAAGIYTPRKGFHEITKLLKGTHVLTIGLILVL